MIPYSYNMVDMGGIDLAEANGTVVPGIYARISEAVNACGDVILYNWKFADIEISPQYTSILTGNPLIINRLIQVTELDVVTVLGISPPPPPIVPVEPLEVTENGTYIASPPFSGFNPVTVNVQQNTIIKNAPPLSDEGYIGQYCITMIQTEFIIFGIKIITPARGTNYSFTYWGSCGIVLVYEDATGNEVLSTSLTNNEAWMATGQSGGFNAQSEIVTGITNTYYEKSGLPGFIKLKMRIPVEYKLKSIRIAPRLNSLYKDFWRTFTFDIWAEDRESIMNILSVVDGVEGDWNFTTYREFRLTDPISLPRETTYSLYKKVESGWILLK